MQAPRAALVFALVIALVPVGRGKPPPLPTPGKEDRKSW
uniref:Transmembrane protein 154 n=1 Tax=Homo sapiens TaxID=9606 RepID=A0A994J5I7_HUMAN